MTATLHRTLDDGVLILTINRPERENRIDRATGTAIQSAMESAREDAGVRAVVLTATGEVFCRGGDMDGFPGGSPVQYIDFARAFADVANSMARLGKPLIGAVNGDALAGGFSLLAGCDMAIAVEGARFGLPELEYGLFPLLALATTHTLLPPKILFDLIYEARVLDAAAAQAHGLINRVVPSERLMDEAVATARRIGSHSSVALRIGRDTFHAMRGMTPPEALEHARLALATLLSTEDGKEAGFARRERREPVFQGR